MNKIYACIDLKSFYASVECVERNLDPLKTNLVVADIKRTEKGICLAVTPSLKSFGIPGRARVFEVNQKLREVNRERKKKINYANFKGKSCDIRELKDNDYLEVDYIIAPPRMSYYMKYSAMIYNIYLKYLSPEDIYVYSIDEVFCDITNYLKYSGMSPKGFITKIVTDIYKTTGITATAGIGSNLFLAKIAMDIVAKKKKPNIYGVRIAELDEMSYRKELWNHKPLTDFWRVGKGYQKKLESNGIFTMGDICRCSINNEELLYKLFGVNAELLIDHAWGYEPCTIKDIKNYKPQNKSISSGQVLHSTYNYNQTKLIIKEQADNLSLDLVSKKLVTNQLVLTINYDVDNLYDENIKYNGEITTDFYGRKVPKPAHGTINLSHYTSSSSVIMENMVKLYDRIINKNLLIRKINMAACNIINEDKVIKTKTIEQLDLFTDYDVLDKKRKLDNKNEEEEKKLQNTILNIKNKYGKNSILKGMNLEEDSTQIKRNKQIGGHHE